MEGEEGRVHNDVCSLMDAASISLGREGFLSSLLLSFFLSFFLSRSLVRSLTESICPLLYKRRSIRSLPPFLLSSSFRLSFLPFSSCLPTCLPLCVPDLLAVSFGFLCRERGLGKERGRWGGHQKGALAIFHQVFEPPPPSGPRHFTSFSFASLPFLPSLFLLSFR